MALAGCASTGQYQAERLPEIVSAGDVNIMANSIETSARVLCGEDSQTRIWAEFKTEDGSTRKSFQAECRAGVQKLSIVGTNLGAEGELKVLAENSRGIVSREIEVKTLPAEKPAAQEPLTFPAPKGAGPNMFEDKKACDAAMRTGDYRYYEPKYFGLKDKNPVDGESRRAVPIESDACVDMLTVSGRKLVVQKEGTILRWHAVNGVLKEPYARDDCGNTVYAIHYPSVKKKEGSDLLLDAEKKIVASWSPQKTEIMYDQEQMQASAGWCADNKGACVVGAAVATYIIVRLLGGGGNGNSMGGTGTGGGQELPPCHRVQELDPRRRRDYAEGHPFLLQFFKPLNFLVL